MFVCCKLGHIVHDWDTKNRQNKSITTVIVDKRSGILENIKALTQNVELAITIIGVHCNQGRYNLFVFMKIGTLVTVGFC